VEAEALVPTGGGLRAYKAKVRFLAATLRRPESGDLRRRALDGEVAAGELVELQEKVHPLQLPKHLHQCQCLLIHL